MVEKKLTGLPSTLFIQPIGSPYRQYVHLHKFDIGMSFVLCKSIIKEDCFFCNDGADQLIRYFIVVNSPQFNGNRKGILNIGEGIFKNIKKIAKENNESPTNLIFKLRVSDELCMFSRASNIWLGLNQTQSEQLQNLCTPEKGLTKKFTRLYSEASYDYSSSRQFSHSFSAFILDEKL